MRRAEREVKDPIEIQGILESCKVLRVALSDEQGLYIVPLNYGYVYEDGRLTFYFHSAKSGRKLSAIRKDPKVAFELDGQHRLIEAEKACNYGFAFDSIIGQGLAQIVDDLQEKKTGLSCLMTHQTGKSFVFDDKMASGVTVWKVVAASYAAKRHL